jgi:hypothetical protein
MQKERKTLRQKDKKKRDRKTERQKCGHKNLVVKKMNGVN